MTTNEKNIIHWGDYNVYWLDEQYNEPLQKYNIHPSKLRAIADFLECFSQIDLYLQNIRQANDRKLFVIISYSSCLQLLDEIHNFVHVHSIYIYRNSSDANNTLNSYAKVKTIYDHPMDLFDHLSQDIRVYLRQNVTSDSVLPFSACSETEERTTAYHSRQHESWFPYLMDALQEIPPISNGKEKFVEECRKIYHNNQPALNFLDEFDRTYRSNMAISWYTREGILYQLFNRTLRQLDQNRVILFHFFIYDMSQQLKTEHETNRNAPWRNESLYRGQRMSKKELEFLQTAAIIYVNTFLSTTRDLSLAKIYAGVGSYPSNSESTEQSVVFNIPPLEWNTFEKNVAAIDHLSHFGGAEGEVLFSPTYLFCSTGVTYDENEAVWNVSLGSFHEFYDLRHEFLSCLIKLDVILRTLIQDNSSSDGQTDEINTGLVNEIACLAKELEFSDDDIISMQIGSSNENNIDVSQFELKALSRFCQSSLPCLKSNISLDVRLILHDCIGAVYKCLQKYDLALENYEKASKYVEKRSSTDNLIRKVKIAQIHKINRDYSVAWKLTQEILNDDTIDDFLKERIFNDIMTNKPPYENDEIHCENYRNCCQYLDYTVSKINLRDCQFPLADFYRNFSEIFLEYNDRSQAIECLKQDVKIRKQSSQQQEIDRLEIANSLMMLANVYDTSNPALAIKTYKQAIDQFDYFKYIGENVRMAICYCEIGLLEVKHRPKMFIRAFDLLLLDDDDETATFVGDNIGHCYMCLAKSYARCDRMSSFALETCEQALRFFLHFLRKADFDSILECEFYGCWELMESLYQTKNPDVMPTKRELYEKYKSNTDESELQNINFIEIFRQTREQLRDSKKLNFPKGLFSCVGVN